MSSPLRLLAIDPSYTATGVAFFEDNGLQAVYLIKTSTKDKDRFYEIAWRFEEALEKYKPDAMAIETQYIAIRSNSVIKVIEVKGLLEGLYYSYCLRNDLTPTVLQIHPNTAKHVIGVKKRLKRKESKQAVREVVCNLFPQLEHQKQDIHDAVAIGLAGLREHQKLSAQEDEKLDKV